MKRLKPDKYFIRGGFLVRNERPSDFAQARDRALDARRRSFSPGDEGEDGPDQDTIEIHNHIPGEPEYSTMSLTGDDEEGEEGEEVARYPSNAFTVMTEDDEKGEAHHVVYRSAGEGRAPSHKTDIFDMGDSRSRARDSRSRAPRTLAQLNAFNAAHYKAKAGRR